MPEATAQAPLKPEQDQTGQIINLDKYREAKLAAISKNVGDAIGSRVSSMSVQPKTDHPIPIQVPKDGSTFTDEVKKEALEVPETFQAESGDNIRHYVDFTDQGAPSRLGENRSFIKERDKRANTSTSHGKKPGPIEKFNAWLHDEAA